jgi:hypothetical protein
VAPPLPPPLVDYWIWLKRVPGIRLVRMVSQYLAPRSFILSRHLSVYFFFPSS